MKIPLKIERISDDVDCYEGTEKSIKYKIINTNRFPVQDINVTAQTVKEDGTNTRSNFCKDIKGVKERLLPKDECEVTCVIKLNKDYNETIEIDGEELLSALDLDIKVTGTLIISRVNV